MWVARNGAVERQAATYLLRSHLPASRTNPLVFEEKSGNPASCGSRLMQKKHQKPGNWGSVASVSEQGGHDEAFRVVGRVQCGRHRVVLGGTGAAGAGQRAYPGVLSDVQGRLLG